jgi:acetyltransferase-like isoleucine patch superfamily enzyme
MSKRPATSTRDKDVVGNRAKEFGISKTRYVLRYLKNWFISKFVEFLPVPSWRVICHRAQGIHIGHNVHIGFEIIFDRVYPHLITIEDDVTIGDRCIITAHSSLESKVGPVCIKKGVCIMPGVIITSGTTIGEHSTIGTGSVVRKDIPPNSLLVPTPSRLIPSSLIDKADQYV